MSIQARIPIIKLENEGEVVPEEWEENDDGTLYWVYGEKEGIAKKEEFYYSQKRIHETASNLNLLGEMKMHHIEVGQEYCLDGTCESCYGPGLKQPKEKKMTDDRPISDYEWNNPWDGEEMKGKEKCVPRLTKNGIYIITQLINHVMNKEMKRICENINKSVRQSLELGEKTFHLSYKGEIMTVLNVDSSIDKYQLEINLTKI